MCSTEQQRQFYAKHGDKWAEYMKAYRNTKEYKTHASKYMKEYRKQQSEYQKFCRILRKIIY